MCELLIELLIAVVLVLHLLAFVVIVDGELLQRLQNFLHLLFGGVIVPLQSQEFLLQTLVVLPVGR